MHLAPAYFPRFDALGHRSASAGDGEGGAVKGQQNRDRKVWWRSFASSLFPCLILTPPLSWSPVHTMFFPAPSGQRARGKVEVPIRVALGLHKQLQIKAITRLHWHQLVCHACLHNTTVRRCRGHVPSCARAHKPRWNTPSTSILRTLDPTTSARMSLHIRQPQYHTDARMEWEAVCCKRPPASTQTQAEEIQKRERRGRRAGAIPAARAPLIAAPPAGQQC